MFLSALALTLASAASPQAPPAEITLNSADRWALLTGLRYRLGGPFVIANLADAEASCKTSGACVTADALDGGPTEAVDLPTVLRATDVCGRNAVALVALRTGKITRQGLRLTVSVFEPASNSWTNKDVWIDEQSTGGNVQMKRISRYEDSAVL